MPQPLQVLVLMPFAEAFRDVYTTIQTACHESGTECTRIDDQYFDGLILERIYDQIGNADVVVAELTGRNPNVFYEVGYAHCSKKRTILIARSKEDIPFDLTAHRQIIYGDNRDVLRNELRTWLGEYVNEAGSLDPVHSRTPLNKQGWRATASAQPPSWQWYALRAQSPDAAMDGERETRWATGHDQRTQSWFQVDMQRPRRFRALSISAGVGPLDYPRRYPVFVSQDGEEWGAPVACGDGDNAQLVIAFPVQNARYLKIVQQPSDCSQWWCIADINVYP